MNKSEIILSIIFGAITLAQSIFAEITRRRATSKAHGAIAAQVATLLNSKKDSS